MDIHNYARQSAEGGLSEADLRIRIDDGLAIAQMMDTEGWKTLTACLESHLSDLTADLTLNCKSWDDYQEKRGKVYGIRLFEVTVADFLAQAQEARELLENFRAAEA